jgi:hypothetical protein
MVATIAVHISILGDMGDDDCLLVISTSAFL